MDWNLYQEKAHQTAIYPQERAMEYLALKLCGECGEIAEKVGKLVRDGNGYMTGERRDGLLHEIGDVLWYCSEYARLLDTPLVELFDPQTLLIYSRNRAFEYLSFKLCRHAGWIAMMLTETIFDNMIALPPTRVYIIKTEITSILTTLNMLSWELGSRLIDVAEQNLAKLADRAARGTLHGDGDKR